MPEYTTCPFTVVVDSREQSSYDFRNLHADKKEGGGPLIIKTERKALKTGDYSIVGLEDQVAIERKEMGDLFHCMGSDRKRFERQLERLNEMPFPFLVVEAGLDRIRRGHERSKLLPKTVFRSVIAYQVDYFPRIHWWFAPGKLFAEHITFRMLQRYWNSHGEAKSKEA